MEHVGLKEKCTPRISRKTSGKRTMVRSKRGKEYKIKISFKELGRQIVYLIHMIQDRDRVTAYCTSGVKKWRTSGVPERL
jgi:hypothetical protein